MTDKPLSLDDVCERFGVTRKTIMRWVELEYLPPPRRIGPRRLYWKPGDIDKVLNGRSLVGAGR